MLRRAGLHTELLPHMSFWRWGVVEFAVLWGGGAENAGVPFQYMLALTDALFGPCSLILW